MPRALSSARVPVRLAVIGLRVGVRPDPQAVAARELLLAVVREPSDANRFARLLDHVEPAALVRAAQHHHVVSLAHERLRRVEGAPREAVETLARIRLGAQLKCLRLQDTQIALAGILGVPWLTVKGDVLAQWHRDPSTREFSDIDIVVQPRDFRSALEALEASGVVPVSNNWRGFLDYGVAEVPLRRGFAVVDLHWHIVGMGESRRHIGPATEALLERAVRVRVGGADLTTLDDVDTLLHLCINVGLDGARRLRGLVDIDAVVRSGRVDLDAFVIRARAARAGRLSSAVLQRTSTLLGTPLPTKLLAELAPGRTWLAVNRAIDHAGGVGLRSAEGVASGLLLGSGYDSVWATARGFGRAATRAVASVAGRAGLTQPGGALDWQRQPEPGRGDDDRREYLEWVAGQAS